MFNRHIAIKFEKNKNASDNEVAEFPIAIPEEAISRVTRDVVNRIAIGAMAVIGFAVVATTIGSVIVNSIDNAQQQD